MTGPPPKSSKHKARQRVFELLRQIVERSANPAQFIYPLESILAKSNASRPEHGLDQQSLVSDPNVDMSTDALPTVAPFQFGLQDTVIASNRAPSAGDVQLTSEHTPAGLSGYTAEELHSVERVKTRSPGKEDSDIDFEIFVTLLAKC